MLSGVPGLCTFTTFSDGALEMTSELPTLVHVMLGSGLPYALHFSSTSSPSTTVAVTFETSTDGATLDKIRMKTYWC